MISLVFRAIKDMFPCGVRSTWRPPNQLTQLPCCTERVASKYVRLIFALGCGRICVGQSTRLQQSSINFNKRLQQIQQESLKNNKNP